AIAVSNDNLAVLKRFIDLTKTRYEVGSGLQQDLLRAQLEQSKLLEELLRLRQQRVTILADINRLLARPAAAPLETVSELSLTPTPLLSVEQLLAAASERRPMYAAYQALLLHYESERKLAELDYYPDFNIWTSYRFRDDSLPDGGTDFMSAGVGINLPVWREKRAEKVAEADSGRRMAQRQFEDFRIQVDVAIQDALAQLQKNRDLTRLFAGGVIPQAQQSFNASLSAYQVGRVDFLTLLDSLMTLYRYQLDYQRALADYQGSLARLEAAVGINFSDPDTSLDQSADRTPP
ncbi:MAG: TolC family protein, partial [Desulfuromonadaceae bacterium]